MFSTLKFSNFSVNIVCVAGVFFCCCLFYQPMDEKVKTWTLYFPARENPNMEMALFDWPIVLQYDVTAKHRLISRKVSGRNLFQPSVRLTNQKPRAFISVR